MIFNLVKKRKAAIDVLESLAVKWEKRWNQVSHYDALVSFGVNGLFSNNALESMNKLYNSECTLSQKSKQIVHRSFLFMKDRHTKSRLRNRDQNQQTIKRQNLVTFKRAQLNHILSIDIESLKTEKNLEAHAKGIFENILATSYLTDDQ